ncbi:MAG: hypothetical protein K9I29_09320 [Bacteroidales bacterium]|nr:hypothetical protein [Bacteroidales bacterium]MCF8328477.1 hypothetical protein [Bacteroidales bacterium]
MKKLNIVMIMLITSFLFMACEKEETATNENEIQIKNNEIFGNGEDYGFYVELDPNIPFENINIAEYGMLHFETMDDFKQTKAELERMTEDWMEAYYTEFEDISTKEMIIMEDSTGYSDEEIFKDFESAMGFNSLRAKIAEEQFEYLQMEDPPIEDDPDCHFIFEESVRTLVNKHEEVLINDSIYKLYEGFDLVIPHDKIDSLPIFRESDSTAFELGGALEDVRRIVYGSSSGGSDCDLARDEGDRNFKRPGDGDYRIKWVISYWVHPWDESPRIAVKTKFKKRATFLGIPYWHKVNNSYTRAELYDRSELTDPDDCSKKQVEANPDFDTGQGGKAKIKIYTPWEYKVASGDLEAYHRGDWIKYSSKLTF